MASATYMTAPWSARTLFSRRWRWLPLAIFFWWFAGDGVYMAWHSIMGNPVYREANFYASSCLFWLCGFIWLPRMSLRELVFDRSKPIA